MTLAPTATEPHLKHPSNNPWLRWGIVGSIVLILGIASFRYREQFLTALVAGEEQLRTWQLEYPTITILAGLIIYTLVAGLTPGAAFLSLAYGWYYGLWQGTLIVSFGSTAGATITFLLSRYLFRDWARNKGSARLTAVQNAFDREGAYYLFTLRLVPAVPFFLINLVMGLTKIRVTTFWWVSQLGMLPGTLAYIYAGSTLPNLKALQDGNLGKIVSWQLLLAFALLGILPLVIKKVVHLFSPTTSAHS
jgi:uncharacterized membrane protein YdjX (TVP38/TMEM64 family)